MCSKLRERPEKESLLMRNIGTTDFKAGECLYIGINGSVTSVKSSSEGVLLISDSGNIIGTEDTTRIDALPLHKRLLAKLNKRYRNKFVAIKPVEIVSVKPNSLMNESCNPHSIELSVDERCGNCVHLGAWLESGDEGDRHICNHLLRARDVDSDPCEYFDLKVDIV